MKSKTDKYDAKHLINLKKLDFRIKKIYDKALKKVRTILVMNIDPKRVYENVEEVFANPKITQELNEVVNGINDELYTTMQKQVVKSWELSNIKNDALVSSIFGEGVGIERYFNKNLGKLESFINRTERGLKLSERVWRYARDYKTDIEASLSQMIEEGVGSNEFAPRLQQYLREPNRLFRRVRDKNGNLQLSKNAKNYHPGMGVYRSSFKNARRLAVTECNMAYRESDYERWQQMDFIVGIKVSLSNNHTCNGVPLVDICDDLQGEYPKDFKFVGWHPHCRCKCTPIMKTNEELERDSERIRNGFNQLNDSVNKIEEMPSQFKAWVKDNQRRISVWKASDKTPYFVRDNPTIVDDIISEK